VFGAHSVLFVDLTAVAEAVDIERSARQEGRAEKRVTGLEGSFPTGMGIHTYRYG